MKELSVWGLTIPLPDHWSEERNEGEPLTLRPGPDDTTGVLQISMLPDEHLDFVREAEDLGALAATLGENLGEGWGKASSQREFSAKLGRLGLATFPQGSFPVMMLFVVATDAAAFLFTWLGPDIDQEALGIVMTTERAE